MSKQTTFSTNKIVTEMAKEFEDLTKQSVKLIIEQFLNDIESHVTKGHKVRIDKLGSLMVKERAARMGRNPQTGEEIHIPASKKVKFTASKFLKEKVGVKKKR